jgi:oligoendopeptidase F
MSKVSITHGGFETIFETLTNSDIKFKPATNSKNKSIPLTTIADVSRHLKSNDRKLRQTTWINFNKAFHAFESTLTQTLYYNYLLLNTNAKIYKFKDYVELTVFSDEINREFILNLYQAIAKFKPLINNYRLELFKKLKQQLHLTELEPWDKTIELSKVNINFDIEQTKQMTLMALKPLGKDYINKIANDVFVNN